VTFGLLTPAFADAEEDLEKLMPTLPKDVVALVQRYTGCIHWAGEPVDDKERLQEMKRVTARLKCDSLERDEATLLKRYPNDTNVAKAFEYIKAMQDGE
jgi:hypothetical protein